MKIDEESKTKLNKINNKYVEKIIEKYYEICQPDKVIVFDDSVEDQQRVREIAVANGEETKLEIDGHTIHFDSAKDQGRDAQNTRVLLPKGKNMSKVIKTIDKEEGLKEIMEILNGIMKGKDMFVKFYSLGPNNSEFCIPSLQITDSAYVLHSENLLYRQGYNEFKKLNGENDFFHFVHSAGKLENGVCVDIDKRRIYMDLEEERVFTVNNQYAGNSVGLKKLALRLAISKANNEDWLCEHMLVMGAKRKGRVTYFTGAFPSACGKTSTAMLPGQSIIGDDIAYIKINEQGKPMAVNVEQGIFGIIVDISKKSDPLIYNALTSPRELIFSNVLENNGTPYWCGMGKEIPKKGINYSGDWFKGKKENDKELLASHKNARYCIRINELENADEKIEDPNGVPVRGFIYGGRDSDTSVPVSQSLDWSHGVFLGASQESETTSATIGAEGIRKFNPMSNIEFLVVPLSVYIKNHLKFGENCKQVPNIFATNYFLRKEGKFLNGMLDKKVWLMWMEGRIHEEFKAIKTPIGYIPHYEDLKELFKELLDKEYSKEEYDEQFTIRTKKYSDKLDRIEKIFADEEDIPENFYEHLNSQRNRLTKATEEFGDEIEPAKFE